jgi:hypothetical protein
MSDEEQTTPENLSVLYTAGLVENVLLNREAKDYPRKLLRASQLLLQSLYLSDLLLCCLDGRPVAVTGAHGPMMIAATDREAAGAYIAAALGDDAPVEFLAASALSNGATLTGKWKSRRDAWRELFNRAGGTYMLLNPAGPGTARVLGVALDDGKPARLGRPVSPPADQFPPADDRIRGRALTDAAVAELVQGPEPAS